MSKRKEKRVLHAHDEEDEAPDDEDDYGRTSQKTPRRRQKQQQQQEEQEAEAPMDVDNQALAATASNMSQEELQKKVKDLVRFALFCERHRMTIKRDDISKKVLKEHARAFNTVFPRANNELRDTFGFEMVAVDARERITGAARKMAKPTAIRQYILKNMLLPPEDDFINWRNQLKDMGLLNTILALILMSERRSLNAERLWSLLEAVNVEKVTNHAAFGDVDKLLGKFIKDGYLNRVRSELQADEVHEYRWGPRAHVLCEEGDLLKFIAQIQGKENDAEFMADLREIVKLTAPATEEEAQEGGAAGDEATQASQASQATQATQSSRRR